MASIFNKTYPSNHVIFHQVIGIAHEYYSFFHAWKFPMLFKYCLLIFSILTFFKNYFRNYTYGQPVKKSRPISGPTFCRA